MSTTDDLELVYQCLRAGADHFILKPLSEHHLRNIWQGVYLKRQKLRRSSLVAESPHHQFQTQTPTPTQNQDLTKLNSEIEKLRSSMNSLVENSIKILSKEVEVCLKQDVPKQEILSTIMKQFSQMDIFNEGFKRMIASLDVDQSTRKWLQEMAISEQEQDSHDSNHNHDAHGGTESVGALPEKTLASLAASSDQSTPPNVSWSTEDFLSNDAERERLLKTIRDWDFDVWSFSEVELLPMLEAMFLDFDLLNRFKIPLEKFRTFLLDVLSNYHKKNPYHNFRHAADVTQTTYLLLTTGGAAQFLETLEIFSLLLAALVHDIGHPGLNNNYQIQTCSLLAVRYNDRNVLENFHASLGFELITKTGLLDNLQKDERRQVRQFLISCILATDLALHMEVTGKWNAIADVFDSKNKDHRTLLQQLLIKTADISNPAKRFDQARYWALLIQEEFFIQGDLEKQQQLPISPFCDRDKQDLPKMQIGFADIMVLPMLQRITVVLPELKVLLQRLIDNKSQWAQIAEDQKSSSSTSIMSPTSLSTTTSPTKVI